MCADEVISGNFHRIVWRICEQDIDSSACLQFGDLVGRTIGTEFGSGLFERREKVR